MSKHPTKPIVGLLAVVGALLSSNASYGAKTYFIDEPNDYGNDCGGSDTNNLTGSLETALTGAGWSGIRYTTNAWPQDLRESCSSTYGAGGMDTYYGDSKALVVFGGHGGPGSLLFGFSHNGVCTHGFQANGRLGSMNGGLGAVGVWIACEVLKEDTLPSQANYQWLRQQLGFHNSIGVGDNEARDFFNATGTRWLIPAKANTRAWLDQMDDASRRPIAITYSNTSASDCWSVYDSAKLKDDVYNTPRSSGPSCNQGQPTFYYCWQLAD